MARRITIIQGNPDPSGGRYGHALADAYARGAGTAGHELQRIEVAQLQFPLLRTPREFAGPPPDAIRAAQEQIHWAQHLVLVYPLWMGDAPALLKGFLEQVLRPGFAMEERSVGMPRRLLKGRSARLLITMGMPAPAYRWLFGAHGVKGMRRSVLGLAGIAPVRATLIGSLEQSRRRRSQWLARVERLGRLGH